MVLKNDVSGDAGALTGTSLLTPTLSLDTLYLGTFGSTADFAVDNVVVSAGRAVVSESAGPRVRVGVYTDVGAGRYRNWARAKVKNQSRGLIAAT